MIILTVGHYKFAIPSASIASAICEVLNAAQQVERLCPTQCKDFLRYRPADDRLQAFCEIEQIAQNQLTCIPDTRIPKVGEAVLAEPARSRRRTHKILAVAAGDHHRAVAYA